MSVEVADRIPRNTINLEPKVNLSLFEDQKDQKRKISNGFFLEEEIEENDERSDTSSIGACSSEEENEFEEVQSKENEENKSSLSSLDSLEDSLPDKRGLSNFYSGKSKSFTSLSNAANATAKDLIKPENPFNKRRRILMTWSRRASCSSLISMESSLPSLRSSQETLEEVDEEEEEEIIEEKEANFKRKPSIFTPIWKNEEPKKAKMPLRSPRSFSLSDLNKHALID